MITVKTDSEIAKMRIANGIVRDVLLLLGEHVKEGVSTAYLDKIAREFIEKQGATPTFLGYNGFPASICASVDDVVVHGIPSKHTILKEGQIVGLDVGAFIHGYNGDAARTFAVGKISPEKQRLIDTTRECFFKGVGVMKDGVRLGDLSHAIQEHAESNGYSVVRELVGHGIGQAMHEDPSVPNYGPAGHGIRMHANMTIAVEPMINMGAKEVYTARDGWTVRTVDGKPSAHYENTILITQEGIEILSL